MYDSIQNCKQRFQKTPCPMCGKPKNCSEWDDGLFLCRGADRDTNDYKCFGPSKGDPQFHIFRRQDEVSGNGRQHIAATHDYCDESGALKFQVVRLSPKGFFQRRPRCVNPRNDVKGDWENGLGGMKPSLYRLPELQASPVGDRVFVTEGEKDADRLRQEGLTATTNPMGVGKWRKHYGEALRDRCVVLLPDNDQPGKKHMEDVRRQLEGIAASVVIVELPDLPPKGDVSDWLNNGGSKDALLDMVARLSPRGRETRETSETSPENKGDSVSPVSDVSDAGGQWCGDLGELLSRVENFLRRFIAHPDEHTRLAHTLWIAHAHAMDAWESTPRLAFLSPEPASGKTRALEVTELLVPRPVESVNATPAYLFRKVSDPAGPPTILFDEIDTLFGPKAKENEDVRGMLNAGHRRGAKAGRCVVRGKTVETEELPAYCAVALAGLGFLPDTLMTRSVPIWMKRRRPEDKVEPFRRRLHQHEGHALRNELAAWATRETSETLASHRPDMPDGITDRAADVWESLLTIADAAGGDWPNRARVSAVSLVSLPWGDRGASLGVRLLADLKTVWERDAETMHTNRLLELLNGLEESPWGDLKGKSLDSRRLARMLASYGVKPGQVRVAGVEKTLKGYRRDDLHDPWQRYVPVKTGETGDADEGAVDELCTPFDREPGEEG